MSTLRELHEQLGMLLTDENTTDDDIAHAFDTLLPKLYDALIPLVGPDDLTDKLPTYEELLSAVRLSAADNLLVFDLEEDG